MNCTIESKTASLHAISARVLLQLKELSGELKPEPLLTPNDQRFVLFPIKHHDVRAACVHANGLPVILNETNSNLCEPINDTRFSHSTDLEHVQEGRS